MFAVVVWVVAETFVRSGWFFNKNCLNASARNTDLVPENIFVRSEFACDFLLPVANVLYSIAATLASQGDVVARVGFHRQKEERNFSDRDKEIVRLKTQHRRPDATGTPGPGGKRSLTRPG
jgi:hypothetical protein